MQNIPTETGSYILWLQLNRKRRITVGRLGEHLFQPGFYAYTGSAFGPGGLKARLGHHLKKAERPHWHIDYLKNICQPYQVWITTGSVNVEHAFAATLSGQPGANCPVMKFGASDCHCSSHLVHFHSNCNFSKIIDSLPNHLQILSGTESTS